MHIAGSIKSLSLLVAVQIERLNVWIFRTMKQVVWRIFTKVGGILWMNDVSNCFHIKSVSLFSGMKQFMRYHAPPFLANFTWKYANSRNAVSLFCELSILIILPRNQDMTDRTKFSTIFLAIPVIVVFSYTNIKLFRFFMKPKIHPKSH